jgi:hypothetical protein
MQDLLIHAAILLETAAASLRITNGRRIESITYKPKPDGNGGGDWILNGDEITPVLTRFVKDCTQVAERLREEASRCSTNQINQIDQVNQLNPPTTNPPDQST